MAHSYHLKKQLSRKKYEENVRAGRGIGDFEKSEKTLFDNRNEMCVKIKEKL
jgi:hypothetical protein